MTNKVKELPWMVTAETLMGTTEVSGSGNNPRILRWAHDIGGWIANFYNADSIAWCGLFVTWCFHTNEITVPLKNPLSALEWNKFGIKTDPCYGAVMVFSRSGGGHVGFLVSEDKTCFHILGGNQADQVNVTRIDKSRFVGARWPTDYLHLKTDTRIIRDFNGKISVNEQ